MREGTATVLPTETAHPRSRVNQRMMRSAWAECSRANPNDVDSIVLEIVTFASTGCLSLLQATVLTHAYFKGNGKGIHVN